jgi:hypothetical protein
MSITEMLEALELAKQVVATSVPGSIEHTDAACAVVAIQSALIAALIKTQFSNSKLKLVA